MRFANGFSQRFEGKEPGPEAVLQLNRARAIYRFMLFGNLGFSRAFIDGDCDSPDIGAFLDFAMANESMLDNASSWSRLLKWIDFLRHKMRHNSRQGSKRNIAYHYDLGNDFYRLWLDGTMTYSSALYTRENLTLEQAQTAKYQRIIDELGIGSDDHILEIGCGWGGFAEHAVRTTGCRVTGLTLSQEQAAFARKRLENAGVADRVDIRLEDYRDCQGSFDAVVSIEMFEAVGEEHWPTYFSAVAERLKPTGQAMIQTITIDEARFDDYRRNADFIQTYIFPGGMLPSFERFRDGAGRAGLVVKDWLNFGEHYARTLKTWEDAFLQNWRAIRPFGFDDRFRRMWQFYLSYCASGFKAHSIDVFQIHLTKSGDGTVS
ncbi:MAG: class I SAM-dependent methyltransferase [Hyphomicrobiaceae bacterium]|nr:class I SAM-dependent methyltransferase [Hyphomicrobiaceae bacterium]